MSKPSAPRIAIVIIGYKSHDYLSDLCESIFSSTYKNFSVYFLENAEHDGSSEFLQKSYPQVEVRVSEENLGFATGNNFLIKEIEKTGQKFDAYFLLNPDTVLSETCLQELADHYSPEKILQPLILLHKDGKKTETVNTMGNPFHYLGFSYAGGNGEPRSSVQKEAHEIPLASGAAMLISSSTWNTLGGFDERFFMYHEDSDLCWRARIAGKTIHCIPNALVWHKYSFSRNNGKFYYFERNRLLLLFKDMQTRTLILLLPILLVTELVMFLYAILGGWAPLKVRASWHALGSIMRGGTLRKKTQSLRTLSDKKLYPLVSANLRFSEVDSLPIKLYNILAGAYWSIIKHI